ncbi:MAG: GIY-YIG nuclease family protein [bacterium]|nr:GIY-YIG nuclease family protein [bacterium]
MVIYKTTNIVNGKIYVGKDVENNEYYIGSGKLIKRAIKKYGKENFKKETLEECFDKKSLCEREIYWIKKLDSTNKSIGYNITKGGEGGKTVSSKEMSKRLKKLWKNPEFRKKQTKSRAGRKNWNDGKKGIYSKSSRNKMSNAKLGGKLPKKTIKKITKFNRETRIYSVVQCVENGMIFRSIKEAKRWLGKGDIASCVSGRQHVAGGYHWIYLSGNYNENNFIMLYGKIVGLNKNQILVFESNTEGRHSKDIAKICRKMLDAEYGNPKGLQGRCYAITTRDLKKGEKSISLLEIKSQILELYEFANKNIDLEFIVTKIGCGIGGYNETEVKEMLNPIEKKKPSNVMFL